MAASTPELVLSVAYFGRVEAALLILALRRESLGRRVEAVAEMVCVGAWRNQLHHTILPSRTQK